MRFILVYVKDKSGLSTMVSLGAVNAKKSIGLELNAQIISMRA